MKKLFLALLPPLLILLTLAGTSLLPQQANMASSAFSPDLPLERDLPGWFGQKMQESEQERIVLARDTQFSKAAYLKLRDDPDERRFPPLYVSLVYSGRDMNSSIHRPERCLPAQGHQGLSSSVRTVTLDNGIQLTFTRLSTYLPNVEGKPLPQINYYIFAGHSDVTHNHLMRTFLDIRDRALFGSVQQWAYFQVGSCWGEQVGITEEECDAMLARFISNLLPRLADWSSIRIH